MVQKRSHKRRPEKILKPIRDEITSLFYEAELFFSEGDMALAKRRVREARRRAMKVQLRIPQFSEKYCRKCDSFLKVGVNCTIRVKQGIRLRTCKECGAVRRKVLR